MKEFAKEFYHAHSEDVSNWLKKKKKKMMEEERVVEKHHSPLVSFNLVSIKNKTCKQSSLQKPVL